MAATARLTALVESLFSIFVFLQPGFRFQLGCNNPNRAPPCPTGKHTADLESSWDLIYDRIPRRFRAFISHVAQHSLGLSTFYSISGTMVQNNMNSLGALTIFRKSTFPLLVRAPSQIPCVSCSLRTDVALIVLIYRKAD